jgi:hypothetical protein
VRGALTFHPRPTPLVPEATLAEGSAARRLARRLLCLEDGVLAQLSGVCAPEVLDVLGAEADLPWVDGVRYLGRDPSAQALFLPTALAPAVPLSLLERALLAAAAAGGAPLALLPEPLRVVPLGAARPVERARLARWLEGSP